MGLRASQPSTTSSPATMTTTTTGPMMKIKTRGPIGPPSLINTIRLNRFRGMAIFTLLVCLVAGALLIYMAVTTYQLNQELKDYHDQHPVSTGDRAPDPVNNYYALDSTALAFGIASILFAFITLCLTGKNRLSDGLQVQPSSNYVPYAEIAKG